MNDADGQSADARKASGGVVRIGSDRPDVPPAGSEVRLGHITSVSGLKGWVKVHSDTDPRDNIVRFDAWLLRAGAEAGWRAVRVLDGRAQGKTIVARLEGIEDRDAAQRLVGSEIAVRRSDLPPAGADEYYWTDLTGMDVVTVDGASIGPVDRLFETGANDVVVVADRRDGAKPGAEILVPWVRPDVVVEVDASARRITIDWDPDF